MRVHSLSKTGVDALRDTLWGASGSMRCHPENPWPSFETRRDRGPRDAYVARAPLRAAPQDEGKFVDRAKPGPPSPAAARRAHIIYGHISHDITHVRLLAGREFGADAV